jgi:hypothetical protein
LVSVNSPWNTSPAAILGKLTLCGSNTTTAAGTSVSMEGALRIGF